MSPSAPAEAEANLPIMEAEAKPEAIGGRTLAWWTPTARADRGDVWLLAYCRTWNYAVDTPRCECGNRLLDDGNRYVADMVADGWCVYCYGDQNP